MKRALLLASTCLLALEAHAATFYVIVAGLGGEPDYEQRFTAAANDLAASSNPQAPQHVSTPSWGRRPQRRGSGIR